MNKLFKKLNDSRQQYDDGLINEYELFLVLQGHINEQAIKSKKTLEANLEHLQGQLDQWNKD